MLAVTLAVMVQLPFTGSVPPVKVIDPAVLLIVPPHCDTLGTLASVKPLGKVSVNATPVRGTGFAEGFVSVKVKAEVAPATMEVGENALLIVGGLVTVNVSQASVGLVAP
jgi:hypothetical protein